MVVKSGAILAWWLVSYLLLVFWAATWWQAGIVAISLGLSVAGMGFNIQHDGGHRSYSQRKLGNRLSALSLDLMGGSSYMWHFKHNILHHQYTNVEGVDDDLEAGPLLRLAEGQQRRWFHRFQHFYIWLLYAFLPPKWQFYDDWHALTTGRIGHQPFPRPRGVDLALLIGGKVVFLGWAVVLPLCFHGVGAVLAVYCLCALVTGMTLGTVFQLAHCVEEADFQPPPADRRMKRSWAEHQLATTVDFSPRSRLLTWYLGGLNYQVEHHLFPRISHVHYPALFPIVRSVCEESRVRHLSHDTIGRALRSHVRYLRRLGCAA
jgi:linoleoyl-CoA desaturase